MAILNIAQNPVVPSDVIGWERGTHIGHSRDTFTINVPNGKTVAVGSVLVLNRETMTATIATVPANAAAVTAVGEYGVFIGRDIVAYATANDFDNLTLKATGKGVAVTRGHGGGTLYKAHLDFDGTKFYSLPDAVQKALVAKFTVQNGFKVEDKTV